MQDKCKLVSELPILGQCPICHCIIVATPSTIFFDTICSDCAQNGWVCDIYGHIMRIENGKVAEILMN